MADGTNYNPISPADARTGLGLTAGGTGDIWVEKAGDTMTGALTNTLATGNSLVWDTNTLVVDATNDRVGIGTVSPGSKLDVTTTALGTTQTTSSGLALVNTTAAALDATTNISCHTLVWLWMENRRYSSKSGRGLRAFVTPVQGAANPYRVSWFWFFSQRCGLQ